MQERFGRWTFIKLGKPAKHRRATVRCDCGTVRDVQLSDLKSGKSRSCGCLRRETSREVNTTHGESHRTTEYGTWAAMLNRCYNENNPRYTDYGGRDIRVCKRWHKYENFLADMGRKPPKTFLERRNNERNYTPSNCYWATAQQQAWNKRNNRYLTYKGTTLPLTEWARRLGIAHATLRERLVRGWPPEDVFNPRKHTKKSRKHG